MLTSLGSARAASKSETASALPARAAAMSACLQDAIACNLTEAAKNSVTATEQLTGPPSQERRAQAQKRAQNLVSCL